MYRNRSWIVLASIAACLLLFAALTAAPVATKGKRAISTAPSITEILFALGEGPNVVGVSEYCRYPQAALGVPRIGSYLAPNQEVILSLRPDRVYIEEVSAPSLRNLPAAGFEKHILRHRSIADIHVSIEAIARGQGVPEAGRKLSGAIRADLQRLEAITSKLPRRRVLFVVGRTPGTLQGIIAAGRQTYIDEIIRIAGGQNCVADAGPAYPNISMETLLARNPEVVLDRGDMSQSESQTAAHEEAVRLLWKRLPTLEAVKTGRVHPVSDDYWVVPGPRVTEAAYAMARLIHPEAGL